MVALQWDLTGQRVYETGVDHGVLYEPNAQGVYASGVAWNGLVTVTESPSGAESNPQYADNIKYLNLTSAEEFGATIEAFTYPKEFYKYDGSAVINGGVVLGQQSRPAFGLSYRSLIGNDLMGRDYGYKLHLVYGAQAAPSEKANSTVNDSPEAATLSWELTTTGVAVGTVNGSSYKPTAHITVDSTQVTPANLAALEAILYGTAGTNARLPLPSEVIGLFGGSLTVIAPPVAPTATTAGLITIPVNNDVDYLIDDVVRAGGSTYQIPGTVGTATAPNFKVVTARPKVATNVFPTGVVTAWQFTKTA